MIDVLMNLPTPLQILQDPGSLIVLGMYGGLMLWEALFPARKLPMVKNWKLRGMIAFMFFFFLSTYLPILWDGYLAEYQFLDLQMLGTFWGCIVGILIYELGIYVWHRSMHSSDTLWKIFHQMHHSAERIDSYGAFYFSPMDMIGFTMVGSLSLVLIAGFTPEATTYIILITTFLAIFQHSNIKTAPWLGYIVQRPESHAIHHARGIHAYNYSDLALYDIIFGTFKNPKSYEHEAGFYMGASSKIWSMMSFKDISQETQDAKESSVLKMEN